MNDELINTLATIKHSAFVLALKTADEIAYEHELHEQLSEIFVLCRCLEVRMKAEMSRDDLPNFMGIFKGV